MSVCAVQWCVSNATSRHGYCPIHERHPAKLNEGPDAWLARIRASTAAARRNATKEAAKHEREQWLERERAKHAAR